jgi:hypothetical protein
MEGLTGPAMPELGGLRHYLHVRSGPPGTAEATVHRSVHPDNTSSKLVHYQSP